MKDMRLFSFSAPSRRKPIFHIAAALPFQRSGWAGALLLMFCLALTSGRMAAQVSLAAPEPITVPAGPLGNWSLSGVVSYSGLASPELFAGEDNGGDLTNGLAIVQKTTGKWQFFILAGPYAFPSLGVRRMTTLQYTQILGAVPEAYAEYVFNAHISLEAGKLPTLIGQESTFTYLNYNIQRGLIWNDMENMVSRGAQLNITYGKLTLNLQYGDGFYSGHFGAPSAALAYAVNAKNTFSFVTLLPNRITPPNGSFFDANAQLYDWMYSYTGKRWSWTPYLIFMNSPATPNNGFTQPAHGYGYALLGGYRVNPQWLLGFRAEYAASNGTPAANSPNQNLFGFGAGAKAFTFSLTPTWQDKDLFARAEFSYAHAMDYVPGMVFGPAGTNPNELRGAAEAGVYF